jgi:hypothetical protein
MKKEAPKVSNEEDTMKDHYDFDYSKAVWGKSAAKLAKEGYPVMVMLRPEVAEVFNSSESVNEALLSLIELSKKARAVKGRRKPRATAKLARAVKE